MNLPPKVVLALKGVCMGIADVIPGVSGGTIALLLGIYQNFLDAINSINPRPLFALGRWARSGFKAEGRAALMEAIGTIHFGFLIPLGMGIGSAIGVGSLIIPPLMERFPEIMRGLFFGLILASLAVPYQMMPRENRSHVIAAMLLAVLATFTGYLLTDPNLVVDTTNEWVEVTAVAGEEPDTLKDVVRRGPSSLTSRQVYWSDKNAALREAIKVSEPDKAARFEQAQAQATGVVATDKKAIKAMAEPYDEVVVPAGTTVMVPRPAYPFVFICGAVAICAMVLPGISGSFMLLVFGVYYFILNALKGTLTQLAHLEFPAESLLFVTLFILGITVGILGFSRVLSWLLRRFPTHTMGVLLGLMAGCMRAIWPYQQTIDGKILNVLPAYWGSTEYGALVAMGAGVVIVVTMSWLGKRVSAQEAAAA